MRQLAPLFAIAAFLVNVPKARAQSLSAFLDSAHQRNLDARLSAEAQVRAGAELGQAWGALLPALTASGGWTHNQYEAVVEFPTGLTTTEKVIITPKDQLDTSLKVEVPLLDATKWARTAASAASLDAAEARSRSTWLQVQRQLLSSYFSSLASKAVFESAKRALQAARVQLEVTQARARAGVANELDVARAEAEVQRNDQLVAAADVLVATSARSLRTLSGLEPIDLQPLPKDDLHDEAPLDEFERQLHQLPQVEAAERDIAAAERSSLAASLALVPNVNAQFTQRFTNATGFQNQSSLYNAGVTFNWRLDVPAVQALRAQHSAAATTRLNAEKTAQQAADQLHSDWHAVRAAISKVKAANGQVTAATKASRLAHQRYEAGVANQLDVIQAERDLFSAEVSDIQAQSELANARASLKLSVGQP